MFDMFVLITICLSIIAITIAGNVTKFETRYGLAQKSGLNLVFQWNELDWDYPTQRDREIAIERREFIPGQLTPIDTDVYYSDADSGNLIFISVPRFQEGVPATISTINYDGKLVPYPRDWRWHQNLQQCQPNRIVSVYRTYADECNRLWVLDTGVLGDDQICPPQLLSFDLRTEQLLTRYEFPKNLYKGDAQSLFVTPMVDVRDPKNGCYDTFVYIADVQGFRIVVYDARTQIAYKIINNLFYPYPLQGYFNIAGEKFDLMDGILGLALTKYIPGRDRTLFFHSLSSVTQNRVETSILRNSSLFFDTPQAASDSFYVYPNTRSSQTVAVAMDKNDIMYFVLTKELALACWNTKTDFNRQNIHILERNISTLQFGSGVKIVRNKKGLEELWILTSRFQNVMTDNVRPTEINFRILAAKVNTLVENSPCLDVKRKSSYSHY